MLLVEQMRCSRGAGDCAPERAEVRSMGFDEMVALGGADMDGTTTATGLRVPPHVTKYRFLCASLVLGPWDRLVGMRVGWTIAAILGSGDSGTNPPLYLEEREVESALWRFQDGFTPVFTLTKEPHSARPHQWGPFDQQSLMFLDADMAALVYQTVGFPPLPPLPGYLGLNEYTPPPFQGRPVKTVRDLVYPWQSNEFFALQYCDPIAMRWRLYCDIRQTDPSLRLKTTIGSATNTYLVNGVRPEENFIQLYPNTSQARSVLGALIYERG